MNQIVNFKEYGSVEALNRAFGDTWLYVGRPSTRHGLAGSVLANRYSHKRHSQVEVITDSRATAVRCFRHWLWLQMSAFENQAIIEAIQQIEPETVLVCCCCPKSCHAEVIAKAATWLRNEK